MNINKSHKTLGCCHNLKNLFLCYNKIETENVF